MANIERKVILDIEQPEKALVQLRAALRTPDREIADLIAELKSLETQTTRLVRAGLEPTRDGLNRLSAQFKTSVQDASQLSGAIRELVAEQAAQARAIQGSAEAQAAQREAVRAELAERRLATQQIAAGQEDLARAARAEAQERRVGLQQLGAFAEDARRLAAAESAERRLGLQQVAAGQEDVNRGVREEADLRRLARLQLAAQKQDLDVARARQFQALPVNQIDAFNRAILGGADGVRRFQEQQSLAQESARVFASVLTSQPIVALRTLATDSRAAGAAMAFLKAQIDFVINSRFGSIALGFAVFGTAIATIRSLSTAFIELEERFARVRAVNVGLADAAQANARALAFVREAAIRTGLPVADLAEKFQFAITATRDEAEAQALFRSALQFSVATGAEFKDSLLALSGILGVYGQTLGASVSVQDKLNLITNLFFTGLAESRGDVNDFVASMRFLGNTAALSNVPLDRAVGIIGLLADRMLEGSRGGRGFDQVLRSLVENASRFNQAFGLGLTPTQIIESPVRALDALREKIRASEISLITLKAELATIFPQNAQRAVLALLTATDEQIARYADLGRQAIDVGKASAIALDTPGRDLGRMKEAAKLLFDELVRAAKVTGLLEVMVLGFRAAALAATSAATAIRFMTESLLGAARVGLSLASDVARLDPGLTRASDAAQQLQQRLRDVALEQGRILTGILGADKTLGAGATRAAELADGFRRASQEAERLSQARLTEFQQPRLAPVQQLELDLARQVTVSLEEQLRIRRAAFAEAERELSQAVDHEEIEKKRRDLIAAATELTKIQTATATEGFRALQLQSERLSETTRSQAVTTQASAQDEIRARRGIIAQIQQQQAAVLRLAATQQLSADQATKILLDLERFQNAQLQAIRQVTEAARRAAEQREDAGRRVERAEERLRDLQDRQARSREQHTRRDRDLLERLQELRERNQEQTENAATAVRRAQERVLRVARETADAQLDAETRVEKARSARDRALREQAEEQRRTLEIEAGARARLILGFPEAQNQRILEQIERLRQAQEVQNLPIKERLQLLDQELGLIAKLRGDEATRLEQQLRFGRAFPQVLAAQRRAAQQLLLDPVRRAAAEAIARLQGLPLSPETIESITGRPFGLTALPDVAVDERRRQVELLTGLNDRIRASEALTNAQLGRELTDAKAREQDRAASTRDAVATVAKSQRELAEIVADTPTKIAETNRDLQKALRDQERIQRDFERAQRNLNENLRDAQAERIRDEANFIRDFASSTRDLEKAQRERDEIAQRFHEAERARAEQLRDLREQTRAIPPELPESALRPRFIPERGPEGERTGRLVPEFPLSPEEVRRQAPPVEVSPGVFTNLPLDRRLQEEQTRILNEMLDLQKQGVPVFPGQLPTIRRQSFSPLPDGGGDVELLGSLQQIVAAAGLIAQAFDRARDAVGGLQQEVPALHDAVSTTIGRRGRSLIDLIEDRLVDRIARELVFPTGGAA